MIFEKDVLYVDNREPEQIFTKLDKKGIGYVKVFLDVGDFVFNDIVFERKEMMDFYSSVQGRMWEQIENMKNNYNRVFVLISGKIAEGYYQKNKGHCKFNENVFYGAIASLTAKRGVFVVRCETDGQLINQLMAICKKSKEPYEGFIKRIEPSSEDVYSSMLACVPGVGIKKAQKILEYYTLAQLFVASKDNLVSIDGIGPKIADCVKGYFYKD